MLSSRIVRAIRAIVPANGGVAEWFKALVLKTSEGLRPP